MGRLFSRVRFLPLTIFAATLMLTVKLGDIWDGVEGLARGAIEVSTAEAQTETTANESDDAFPAATDDGMPATETGAVVDGMVPDEGPGAAAERLVTQDPTLLTQQEIELLQQLAQRREELDRRERELEIRGGMLRAAEERIDNKIQELKSFQTTIDGLIKKYDKQQDEKMQSLVKIYENMKPKDAARIFENLEMNTLLLVAERMKERKLAAIMADMDPRKARDMTVELSRLRDLPEEGSLSGG